MIYWFSQTGSKICSAVFRGKTSSCPEELSGASQKSTLSAGSHSVSILPFISVYCTRISFFRLFEIRVGFPSTYFTCVTGQKFLSLIFWNSLGVFFLSKYIFEEIQKQLKNDSENLYVKKFNYRFDNFDVRIHRPLPPPSCPNLSEIS